VGARAITGQTDAAAKSDRRILEVSGLRVSFDTYAGEVQAVRGVDFHLDKGETLAIVGESGCGKSVSVQSVMRLIPSPPARTVGGTVSYDGVDITAYSDRQMEPLRGRELSMIFQDPMTSLNPTMRVGRQIMEGIRRHDRESPRAARERTLQMMRLVEIPDPDENMLRYPHTYSGGMRQRIMIAMALACNPKVLFADEPTTALDMTIQAQILDLMNGLKERLHTGIVLITHDLGVVARMAERISIMYAGQIVESGSSSDVFYEPRHPYTWGLLGAIPSRQTKLAGRRLVSIPGTPPDLFSPPAGCGFAPRCKYRMKICETESPDLVPITDGHGAACWLLHPGAPRVEPPRGGEADHD